jgi:hypothetical protein
MTVRVFVMAIATEWNNDSKAYIKTNRNDENACHEAIKLLMNRRTANTPKYPYDLPSEEMEAIFKAKL